MMRETQTFIEKIRFLVDEVIHYQQRTLYRSQCLSKIPSLVLVT